MSHKAISRSSVLQTLLDDSNRLAPFTLALLDDLDTHANIGPYLRHLVKSWAITAKYPKHLTVLCLESDDKEQFLLRNRLQLNQNVALVNEDDLETEFSGEFDLRNEEFLSRLVSYNSSTMDNVLLIDSLVPLFMSQAGVTTEAATKNICSWLHQLQSSFSHIAFVLHTDFTSDRYVELALSHFSNVILDFRLKSGCTEKQLTCPLVKLIDNSTHVHIVTKKKHPRTYLKVTRQHEHFQVDKQSGEIRKHLSSDELNKILMSNINKATNESEKSSNASSAVPESTFSLMLKKDEQEAKDSLILPYMRKNTTTINTSVPNSGELTNTTVTTASSSQIVYHYDQFDDFDEDDPDDDLDF